MTSVAPPLESDVRNRCVDVLDAMIIGSYGNRVRSHARAEVELAWTKQHLDDAPRVLAGVLTRLRMHMHAIHAGEIAQRVVLALTMPGAELVEPPAPGAG